MTLRKTIFFEVVLLASDLGQRFLVDQRLRWLHPSDFAVKVVETSVVDFGDEVGYNLFVQNRV